MTNQTIRRARKPLAALLLSLSLLLLGPAASALADTSSKVTICHATESLRKPYVKITIARSAEAAHSAHQDGRDIIPAPDAGCDAVTPPPPVDLCPNLLGDQAEVPPGYVVEDTTDFCIPEVTPEPGVFVPCVVSAGVQQTDTTVTGTPADDTIDCSLASPGKMIDGLEGNDTITGTQFLDTITGGDGNDTITGLGGDDVISGNNGNNTISGGEGNDNITSGTGSDTLSGEAGNDFLDGGLGIDSISGGLGDDSLVGPNNDSSVDTVSGGDGVDTCTGPGLEGDIVSGCETQTA